MKPLDIDSTTVKLVLLHERGVNYTIESKHKEGFKFVVKRNGTSIMISEYYDTLKQCVKILYKHSLLFFDNNKDGLL